MRTGEALDSFLQDSGFADAAGPEQQSDGLHVVGQRQLELSKISITARKAGQSCVKIALRPSNGAKYSWAVSQGPGSLRPSNAMRCPREVDIDEALLRLGRQGPQLPRQDLLVP